MPILIFLHGLLGSNADWQKLIQKLPHFHCIALDLPWHASAKHIKTHDFVETADYLSLKINAIVNNNAYFLIGYSLGGRLALYYALQAKVNKGHLRGLIVEGANLGLKTEAEKQARWLNDQQWARRFRQDTPQTVLNDWYQQPVFSHLTQKQRTELIQQRIEHYNPDISNMLLATSLAKQPDFRIKIHSDPLPIYYIVGEKDQKFNQMALDNQLNVTIIKNAGHNAHAENPQEFAEKLTALLQDNFL